MIPNPAQVRNLQWYGLAYFLEWWCRRDSSWLVETDDLTVGFYSVSLLRKHKQSTYPSLDKIDIGSIALPSSRHCPCHPTTNNDAINGENFSQDPLQAITYTQSVNARYGPLITSSLAQGCRVSPLGSVFC